MITFKLKILIDVNTLAGKRDFTLERSYQSGETVKKDVLECRILGIQKPIQNQTNITPRFDGVQNTVLWVEISGAQYIL